MNNSTEGRPNEKVEKKGEKWKWIEKVENSDYVWKILLHVVFLSAPLFWMFFHLPTLFKDLACWKPQSQKP